MNESVIRSPKWLRNFVDFEINTGEDIKGEPSKKMKKKLEEEERLRLEKEKQERQEKERLRKEKEENEKKERDERRGKEFDELFDVVRNYIENHYRECIISVPKTNYLTVEDDGITYKKIDFKFKVTLDNTVTKPTFSVYIKWGKEEYSYTVSGLLYGTFKMYLMNYVYEYMKTKDYQNKHKNKSNTNSNSSKSKYDDYYKDEEDYYRNKYNKQDKPKDKDSIFDDYFKAKYGSNINDYGKKTKSNKPSETEEVKNKRRRYNLLKDTLVGYERELFNIQDWKKNNSNKKHQEEDRVNNEITNLKSRMKQMNDIYKFENSNYKFTHLKRFNS